MRLTTSIFQTHPRLLIAAAIGLVVGSCVPGISSAAHPVVARFLIGWNSFSWLYLVMAAVMMFRVSPERMRERSQMEDESGGLVLMVTSIGAIASLVAIVAELSGSGSSMLHDKQARMIITALTVVGTWLLVGMLYTVHYARMFYTSGKDRPLQFPDKEKEPDYWDFLYFAYTIAVALQTSDVAITSRPMRKVVLAQQLLCFVFNTSILGLTINVAASLVS